MSSFYIYKITNKVNGKIYIGKSVKPNERFKRHLYIAKSGNKKDNQFQPIHAAIAKYGSDNFCLEVIDESDLEEEIFKKEIFWISYYKSNMVRYPNGMGYNLTDGGEGASGLSPTLVTRNKISKTNSGSGNGMFKKTHSLNTREQMKKSQKMRSCREPITQEHKQKNRDAALKQDFSFRIPIDIKLEIIDLWNSGSYTKRQLAEKFNLKYNSVVKIIRTHKTT